MSRKKILMIAFTLISITSLAVACGSKTSPTETSSVPTESASPVTIPFESTWAVSGHADITAPAFNHWNEDDPRVIPAECTRCHTSNGLTEYISTGKTNESLVPGGVITCSTCHNDVISKLTSVTFPSGNVIDNLGPEARCITCHQGLESKSSVDSYLVEKVGAQSDQDKVSTSLSFQNIHYFAAGATMYATQAAVGYQYDGQLYDRKFMHVENMDTCQDCHDNHSLEVNISSCTGCHESAISVEDLKNIRMQGSLVDYDGDGDVAEGIYFEIQGLQEKLYAAIQAYAIENNGSAIVYDPTSYPYFFNDLNKDGALSEGEAGFANTYTSWTPRLIKATYNYHFTVKDPGAFAHNAKYAIELLYDSIVDIQDAMARPMDLGNLHRTDSGHFNGTTEAFRHWDSAGEVDAGCAKCHSSVGLPQFLKYGTNIGVPLSNGFMCSTCHDMPNFPSLSTVSSVTFPGGKTVSFGGKDADGNFVADNSNGCLMCHQGRESTASLNAKMAGIEPNTMDPKLTFRNVHYFAAGASLFGNDVQVAYQFTGKTYLGQNTRHPLNKCVECHSTHSSEVKLETCTACHRGVASPAAIRLGTDTTDWDGDGNKGEPIKDEITTLQEVLYAQIRSYADANSAPIVYGPVYPYWVNDLNANGIQDVEEATRENGYTSFTPNLLAATYNYHFLQKEPGNYAHNPKYSIQLLYDSLESLGADMTSYTRP
jgi:hypothetical protein